MGLIRRRAEFCGSVPNDVRLDMAVSSSAKHVDTARPTEGGKAFRAETLSGSARSGGVGCGGGALTLGGKAVSRAPVVRVSRPELLRGTERE